MKGMEPKTCIVVVANEAYARAACVMLHSLLQWVARPFDTLVFHTSDLSEASKTAIEGVVQGVRFQVVDSTAYPFESIDFTRVQPRLRDAFYKFEAFRVVGYDKVIVMDVDMLVLGSLDPLFEVEGKLCARPAMRGGGFNTGLLVLDASVRSEEAFQRLIQNMVGFAGHFADQDVISRTFPEFAPLNETLNCVADRVRTGAVKMADVVVLHYTGVKPWEKSSPDVIDWVWLRYAWRRMQIRSDVLPQSAYPTALRKLMRASLSRVKRVLKLLSFWR